MGISSGYEPLEGDRTEALSSDLPDFSDLFEDVGTSNDTPSPPTPGRRDRFRRCEKLQQEPHQFFSDTNYYKTVLTGEGEIAARLHQTLGAFLKADNAEDRSLYRGRLIPVAWEVSRSIAAKVTGKVPMPKRLYIRFGLLLPTMVTAEHRQVFSTIILEGTTGEPVYYIDEWMKVVGTGQVRASATDETQLAARNRTEHITAMREKMQGRYEAQENLVRGKCEKMIGEEAVLQRSLNTITTHAATGIEGIFEPYDDGARAALSEISGAVRNLSRLTREVERGLNELNELRSQLEELKAKEAEEEGEATVDTKAVLAEFDTVRQMAKLTAGRQGNHFPLLAKQFVRPNIREIGTRENVINILADIEELDPSIFLRTFKQQTTRIVPNVVLIPSYGDYGICWEPFEKHNRATSRGRIAIPMYPKDLRAAVISALADLRWQVAKEKAQHHWMEEGLTGWYYQWFSDRKMKGDVKDSFVQDYILWISKESEGTQKLDREVRSIFWMRIPFPQEIKDRLKNRGFVYSELYKQDVNRSLSDGY